MGRKRKATVLKLLQNDKNNARRLNRNEPVPELPMRWQPPESLSENQRAIWVETALDVPAGLLRNLDRRVFRAWVLESDVYDKAVIEVFKEGGMIETTTNGNVVQSPYVGIMHRAALTTLKYAEQLGFTPVSRTRIQKDTGTGENTNPFEKHAAKRA